MTRLNRFHTLLSLCTRTLPFVFLAFRLLPLYGALQMAPCGTGTTLCGTLARPLDPTGAIPGLIEIAFRFYPARDTAQAPVGTIVAVEGGPGFAPIASAQGYLGLFYLLMDRRNLLLVDNRGTGQSAIIRCEPLQTEPVQTVRSPLRPKGSSPPVCFPMAVKCSSRIVFTSPP